MNELKSLLLSKSFYQFIYSCLILLITSFLAGCGQSTDRLFTKISSSSSGIEFKNYLVEDNDFNVLNYPYFYNGGGVAVGDINNDGLPDILFTGNMVRNRLYLNKGDFKFEDITEQSTVASKQGWCTGATMVDINADGWLDIYICRSADGNPDKRKNLLFINNHDNTFSEQAEKYGIADKGYSTHAVFFDYDKDNDLDLVVINHSIKEYMQGAQEKPGIRTQTNPDYGTHLYRNDGGHYSDMTSQAGVTSNVLSFGLGVAVSDLNNDSWPDIYISNDFNEADYCFINQQNGTFKEMSRYMFSYTSLFSMGNDAADINNDGFEDLITLDMLPEGNYLQKMHNGSENFNKFQILFNNGFFKQYSRNMLQLNRGNGTFDEVGQFSGISNTDWSWAPLAADFDDDGRKDIFITNGYVKDYTDMDYIKYNVDIILEKDPAKQQEMMKKRMDKLPTIKVSNYMFRNDDSLRFSNQTIAWGLNEELISAGAAYADLDNDGDLDIVTNNSNDIASIYRNNSRERQSQNHYLSIRLEGSELNKFAIGAKVTLNTTSGIQVQEMMPSRGFQSSVDYTLHFGIPSKDSLYKISVDWPDGKHSFLNSPGYNKTITISAKNLSADTATNSVTKVKPFFQLMDSSLFKHTENYYNDYTQQVLIPQWFSRQGPAMAKADINGDKLEDVFIGGAKDQAGIFLIQNANGTFTKLSSPALGADATYEDVCAALFDADGDGDNDLFVGSGGYEFLPTDPLLQNRIYINNGKGIFTRNVNALPTDNINDNTVSVGDFNKDGFTDIFNGGFCTPGKYPESSGSQLLLNDGKGNFVKQNENWLKGFNTANMVSSSACADINKDGRPDLVIAGHWMGVEVWLNKNDHFEKDSTLIKAGNRGFFNIILAEDIDGDGDIDIVAGNQGLNNQYKTSTNEPMEMYYDDFDGNGTREPVIAYYIDHRTWPIYSRDDFMQQLPSFNKKYLFYSEFAKAEMKDLFGDKLQKASHYIANEMRSIVFENKGNNFVERELPKEAQWYPIYTITLLDVNGDGKKDIVTAGNQSYSRIKFGAYSSGKGDIFINKGECQFERLAPPSSGLYITGDVRNSLAIDKSIFFGVNNEPIEIYKLNQ